MPVFVAVGCGPQRHAPVSGVPEGQDAGTIARPEGAASVKATSADLKGCALEIATMSTKVASTVSGTPQ